MISCEKLITILQKNLNIIFKKFFVGSIFITFVLFIANTKGDFSNSDCIEIQGNIYESYFDKSGDKIGTKTNNFITILSKDRAKITIPLVGHPTIREIEYGFLDESSSYMLVNYHTNRVIKEAVDIVDGKYEKQTLKEVQKPINDASITINEGRVPEYGYGITPVWIAYCLNYCLTITNTSVRMTPLFPLGRNGHTYRKNGGLSDVSYELYSNDSLFPIKVIEEVNEGSAKGVDISFLQKAKAFTNTVYNVIEWTNIANMDIPKRFYVTNYFPENEIGGKVVYEGVSTSFEENKDISWKFQIPEVTYVTERRSSYVEPLEKFNYVTTNGHLMSREDILKNEEYIIAANEAENLKYPNQLLRGIFIVLSILVCFICFVIIARKKN